MSQDQDIDGFFSTARTAGRAGPVEQPSDDYLGHLHPLDDPRLADCRGMSYEEFTADRYRAPFLQELLAFWDSLYREPFVGVTTDGVVREGLYALPEDALPEDPEPDPGPVRAAEALLAVLDDDERDRVRYPLDAPQWRAWSNPEFVVHRVGLRLEDIDPAKAEAFLALVRACLSPEGWEKVHGAMALNGFLGDLVELPRILNSRSYWAALYGTPSATEPWGWQLFGHHVAVNFLAVGGRHVIAPVFLGAEPAVTDAEHPPLFARREELALALASSLSEPQRARAVVYGSVLDPAMPEGRVHPADERHVAGAFRDNRVIPYEGIPAAELSADQLDLLRSLVADALVLLVEPQRRTTMHEVEAYLDETWFAWYGATDGSQPFYFRIQSPVLLTELDHHAGVWLANRLPARFHVHTTLRLPNGNDYGRALIARWRDRTAPPR